jgi:hypothetical protein
MKCQRCGNDKEAEFRVVSDILDIKVCADCATEARKIGLSLEIVKIDKANNERAASNARLPGGNSERWRALTAANAATEKLIQRD